MDNGLIIGYDLCKDYCRISYYADGQSEPEDLVFSDEENPYLVQNSICKKKGQEIWLIGEEAYETALLGDGMIVDKLLRLVKRNGFATFEGVRYSAEELLYHFLEETLKLLFEKKKTTEICQISFAIQELDSTVLDAVIRCMRNMGVDRKRIHIISHTESFLYYVISQPHNLWSNQSVLFDLSGDGLNFYELEVQRGSQPNIARARRTFLEEGFSLDILDNVSGRKMADNIMASCVDRMLEKRLISSAYLSGKGMDSVKKWGDNFLRKLCNRRRVFFIENLFAKGAVYAACDYVRETTAYPYRIMCEGRISVDISMEITIGLQQKTLLLAKAGDNWYETKSDFDIIPDNESSLKLLVRKMSERNPVSLEIPFENLISRGNKRSRIGISVSFTSDNTFTVTMRDKGFGELFPASENAVKKTFTVE